MILKLTGEWRGESAERISPSDVTIGLLFGGGFGMRIRAVRSVCCLFVLCAGWPAAAAELTDCVKFAVQADGAASLTNQCSDRLNVTYCVDNPNSPRVCSQVPLGVTMLAAGAVELIPSYTADGAGRVHWAVCTYPEAPINWKPGPDSPFLCRKTCVMC